MNKIDKISKHVMNLFEYSKDVIKTSLVTSNNSGKFDPKLTDKQLTDLINLVEISLSQGYQKGLTVFQKSVKDALVEDAQKTSDSRKKK